MNHTKGAMQAAKVIMNGRKRVSTEYGAKHLEGIADMIDMATGEGKLLEAAKWALSASMHLTSGMREFALEAALRDAIQQAEEGE